MFGIDVSGAVSRASSAVSNILTSPADVSTDGSLQSKDLSRLSDSQYEELNSYYYARPYVKNYSERKTENEIEKLESQYSDRDTPHDVSQELNALRRHLELLQMPEYGDTPGPVVVQPGNQEMRFAVGDVVTAETQLGQYNRANASDQKMSGLLSEQIRALVESKGLLSSISGVTESILKQQTRTSSQNEEQSGLIESQTDVLEGISGQNEQLKEKLSGVWEDFRKFGEEVIDRFNSLNDGVHDVRKQLEDTASSSSFDSKRDGSRIAKPIPRLDGSGSSDQASNVENPTEALTQTIIQQESSGRSGVVNRDAEGDRVAYGLGQVLGENVPRWTEQALGESMTPQEFLQD
ncbi:MAG: hypothetical protein ABEI54_01690, partial [Candidatus Bipolaricaulia bacterium]